MNIEQQTTNRASTTSPGVEIHLIDAEGRPTGGVFSCYRVLIETSERAPSLCDVVVELYDNHGVHLVPLVIGLHETHASRLVVALGAAIRQRDLISREYVGATLDNLIRVDL